MYVLTNWICIDKLHKTIADNLSLINLLKIFI